MRPSYLNLRKKEIKERIEKLFKILKSCELCPRACKVNRLREEKGWCQLGSYPYVSAYHPHFGEEPPLVGKFGSGTIFLTSCNLNCVYCQNYRISQLREGEEISFGRLAEMMLELQNRGCHNINFVTPTPQVPQILQATLIAIENGLKIPLVYNTNSYDAVTTLALLKDIFDIYLPDAKYAEDEIAWKYSRARNYFSIMKKAIKEMYRQVGNLVINNQGIAERGLMIRHLVLPNNLAGSLKIFEFLVKEISPEVFLNIMDQYYPSYRAYEFPELARRITLEEFQKVLQLAQKLGLRRIYY